MERRQAALASVLALASAMALASCVDQAGPDDTRASEVYTAVVRWFVHDETGAAVPATLADDERFHVFLEPRGEGGRIDLQVQTELIDDLAGVAEVRFIDAIDEAIERPAEEGGAAEVRDEGVLLRLDPVPEDGDRVELDVDRWLHSIDGADEVEEVFETLRFEVVSRGDGWQLVGEPEVLTPG